MPARADARRGHIFVVALTLNMLNCFEDYKICIHISYHILDFIQQKKIKVTMEQPYVLPILYCQCHACWCTGDFRSQCINRHGIDLQSRNIPSLASEELSIMTKACPCHFTKQRLLRIRTNWFGGEHLRIIANTLKQWNYNNTSVFLAIFFKRKSSNIAACKKQCCGEY